jgi:hypothetical protein
MKYVIGAGIVLLAVLIAGINLIPGYEEPLTELYFSDHLNLPTAAAVDEPIRFSFTIHNLEGEDMVYEYAIEVVYDDAVHSVVEDSVVIADGFSETVDTAVAITEPFERARVEVLLENKGQSIHFWVDQERE